MVQKTLGDARLRGLERGAVKKRCLEEEVLAITTSLSVTSVRRLTQIHFLTSFQLDRQEQHYKGCLECGLSAYL